MAAETSLRHESLNINLSVCQLMHFSILWLKFKEKHDTFLIVFYTCFFQKTTHLTQHLNPPTVWRSSFGSWFLSGKITFVFFAITAAWRGTIMSYWLSGAQPPQWDKSLAASEKIDLPLNPEPAIAINKHYTFYKPPTTRSMAVNISGHNRDAALH